MQVKVNISHDVISWIMAQIDLETISAQVKENLLNWYSGTKQPTYKQIETASKSTGIPFGYFFLKTPPEEDLSLLNYRTVDSIELSKPSRELVDTIHYMEEIQDWAKSDALANGGYKLSFVGGNSRDTNVKKIAADIRNILGLQKNWFTKLNHNEEPFNFVRNAISNTGVIVMLSGIVRNNTRRTLSINEFRAFAIVDDVAPIIFINSNDSKGGKLFSLLHEFVHVCIGENSFFNGNDDNDKVSKIEQICNAVTAEVLVPNDLFKFKWNENTEQTKEKTICELSKFFKCGETVIARRALDNKFINEKLYYKVADEAKEKFNEYKRKQKENPGGNYYNTMSSRIDHVFFNKLLSSVFEGRTQYSEAFKLTNTNRASFNEMVSRAGGVI